MKEIFSIKLDLESLADLDNVRLNVNMINVNFTDKEQKAISMLGSKISQIIVDAMIDEAAKDEV